MKLEELGRVIREKREQKGISIDEVAARIKVSARILKSIEDGAVESLPHAVYCKGFIRSFALLVGFDPQDLDQALEDAFPPEAFDDAKPEPNALYKPMPSAGILKRIAVLVVLVALLGGILAGGWYVVATYGDAITDLVKKPFSAVTPHEERPAYAVAVDRLDPPASVGAFSPVVVERDVPGGALEPSVEDSGGAFLPQLATSPAFAGVVVSNASQEVATGSGVPEMAAVLPTVDEPQQVFITAREDCYLRVKADQGQSRHYMLRPDDTLPIEFVSSLSVVVGNAGGISVSYNGRDLGEIGQKNKRKELHFPLQ